MNWFTHTVATSADLDAPSASVIEYVLAGNGVFAHARRSGLTVLLPIAPCEVRGLPELEPFVRLEYPRLPGAVLAHLVEEARDVCRETGRPVEALFHILWDDAWVLVRPRQEASATHVRPLDTGIGSSYERAIVEIHSHHGMEARFSRRDDADERTGFRIYGVLGRLFDAPELTLRVGCHGHFFEVPASTLFSDADATLAASRSPL